MLSDQLNLHDHAGPVEGIYMVPAFALANSTAGPVLVLSPDTLLGRSAAELRASGFVIPDGVPDVAIVMRDPSLGLVYKWRGEVNANQL